MSKALNEIFCAITFIINIELTNFQVKPKDDAYLILSLFPSLVSFLTVQFLFFGDTSKKGFCLMALKFILQ